MSDIYGYTLLKPLLQVKDVSISLGGKKILDRLCMEVRDIHRPGYEQGQIVALLGPSGVGKSTLFRLIAGLDKPDSGEILVGLDAKPTEAGRVGVVMQKYPLLMHRTVLDNLLAAGGGASLGRALELLKGFDLEDKASAWPIELSGGQRQRIAIAQQMLCSEHMILMDEPFSGLDPVAKAKACDLIEHVALLHEENTIVIVTHDIRSAVHIADHVWLIGRDRDKNGKVIPGAKIQEDIDLKTRGIAWRPHNESLPAFDATVREIEARFVTL